MYPPISDFLAREQIRLFTGITPIGTTDIDVVIVVMHRAGTSSETCSTGMRFQSLPGRSRAVSVEQPVIVVAGTHGKDTATDGVAAPRARWIRPCWWGGIAELRRSYRLGSGRDFVIEGDECSAFSTNRQVLSAARHRHRRQRRCDPPIFIPIWTRCGSRSSGSSTWCLAVAACSSRRQ